MESVHQRLVTQVDRLLDRLPADLASALLAVEEHKWSVDAVHGLYEKGIKFCCSLAVSHYVGIRSSEPAASVEEELARLRGKTDPSDGDYGKVLELCLSQDVAGFDPPPKKDLPETARLRALIGVLQKAAGVLSYDVTSESLGRYVEDSLSTSTPQQVDWLKGWGGLLYLRNNCWGHTDFEYKGNKLRGLAVKPVSGSFAYAAIIELLSLPGLDDCAFAQASEDCRIYTRPRGGRRSYIEAPAGSNIEPNQQYLMRGVMGGSSTSCVPYHNVAEKGLPGPLDRRESEFASSRPRTHSETPPLVDGVRAGLAVALQPTEHGVEWVAARDDAIEFGPAGRQRIKRFAADVDGLAVSTNGEVIAVQVADELSLATVGREGNLTWSSSRVRVPAAYRVVALDAQGQRASAVFAGTDCYARATFYSTGDLSDWDDLPADYVCVMLDGAQTDAIDSSGRLIPSFASPAAEARWVAGDVARAGSTRLMALLGDSEDGQVVMLRRHAAEETAVRTFAPDRHLIDLAIVRPARGAGIPSLVAGRSTSNEWAVWSWDQAKELY